MSKSRQSPTPSEIKQPNWLFLSIVILACVIVIFLLFFGLQLWIVKSFVKVNQDNEPPGEITALGLSGDLFGFSNAVFSAGAFAMIIVTLWMQKYELEQQRTELGYTRDVLEKQQSEMQSQNESLQRQTFENTFFNMMELHGQIVSEIVAPNNGSIKGRTAFPHLINSLWNYSQAYMRSQHQREIRPREVTLESYDAWYLEHESEVGHYFRTLYNILRYIDDRGGELKYTYSRLVRAQLSKGELKLLFYNGLSRFGNEKCKPLMEKFALLKHLSDDRDISLLAGKYLPEVFGSSEHQDT